MKKIVEIKDSIDERVDMAIEEVKDLLIQTLEEKEPEVFPDMGDLDYYGQVHQIIDSFVPIYHSDIRDIWYLYEEELEEAYSEAGIGDNPRENEGMAAIYCLIGKRVNEWYDANAQDIFNEWREGKEGEGGEE